MHDIEFVFAAQCGALSAVHGRLSLRTAQDLSYLHLVSAPTAREPFFGCPGWGAHNAYAEGWPIWPSQERSTTDIDAASFECLDTIMRAQIIEALPEYPVPTFSQWS